MGSPALAIVDRTAPYARRRLNRFRGMPGLSLRNQRTERRQLLNSNDGLQRATFAAGCFWGIEAAFREIEGVVRTSVGYTGGRTVDPSYEQVCSDTTGHAEAVDVWFDPTLVSYDELVNVFWSIHDPTTRNRQGWDFGSQYRSAIFFHDADQEQLATASRDTRQASTSRPIVTEIVPAVPFYDAEDYHQRYFEKHGGAACATTVRS
jgi:peptide-methionine (S)-S-oxide reductase